MRPATFNATQPGSTERFSPSSMTGVSAAARASLVNRTHRVVRERARTLQANRTTLRGMVLPLLLCSMLMITLVLALWMLLDQYDIVSSELSPSLHNVFLLLLWFLPVSGGLTAVVWFRRSRNRSEAEAMR